MNRGLDRRTALLMIAGAAVAPVLAACGTDDRKVPDGALPVIRWGYFPNYQPVYVGVAKGFFREAGVDVSMAGSFTSGPAVAQAAGTGQVDAGHCAITGLAGAAAAGFKVCGIADSQTEFIDAPLQQWFVRSDSPIRSVADLKGKKIATNALSGSFYYTALIALDKAGLTKNDVQFVTLSHDKQGQALRSGQVDVAGLIDPYSVQFSHDPTARRLFTGAEVLGQRQFSLVFFSRDFIAKNPSAVDKFLAGYRRAITFMKEQPAEAGAIMAAKLGLAPTEVIPHRYIDGAAVRPDDVQFWVDTMRKNGELKDAPRLKAADLLDLSFHG